MFLRALLAFLALPGVFAFLLPPLIGWLDPWRVAVWWPGAVLMTLGGVVLLWCVRDFYVAGKGTLAPWHPPQRIVVVGLYRLCRNPMYLGVLMLVLGWGLTLGSPLVLGYVLILAIAFHIRVVTGEEPWLAQRFPKAWQEYRESVPRWLPRP